jgi:hypothetical protein
MLFKTDESIPLEAVDDAGVAADDDEIYAGADKASQEARKVTAHRRFAFRSISTVFRAIWCRRSRSAGVSARLARSIEMSMPYSTALRIASGGSGGVCSCGLDCSDDAPIP